MHLNWLSFQYRPWDGYGRYSGYMIRALLRAGVKVSPLFAGHADMPNWLLSLTDTCFDGLAISCLPPYYLRKLPKRAPGVNGSRHWLLTMTEGSDCPPGWAEMINDSDVERVIVPCEHNAIAFRNGGVRVPISVVPGGTEPGDFPLRTQPRDESKPYTFLALADRGDRKGWNEVYDAFFAEFGTVDDTGPDKVRLIIKSRPEGNHLIDFIVEHCANVDPRITFMREDVSNIADFYALGDCLAIPSRSEGWGMPHREAAMMGLPVITQAYSGMDDGHTSEWAIVVEGGHTERIPQQFDDHLLGNWQVCNRQELAKAMRACYDNPERWQGFGTHAAQWLRQHQTWDHSARALIGLIKEQGAWR